jgi:hypothetical protein
LRSYAEGSHKFQQLGLPAYNQDEHRDFVAAYAQDPGIVCGYLDALSDWVLGHPARSASSARRSAR